MEFCDIEKVSKIKKLPFRWVKGAGLQMTEENIAFKSFGYIY
jgi:hypothetical protein